MVIVKRFGWVCIAALMGLSAQAQDLSAYKIGDKAAQDIVATVPFDVVDAQATANLKAAKAQKIAAIYHQFNGETNVIAKNFLTSFIKAQSDFTNAVAAQYNQPTLNNQAIESSDFGYFLTAYNVGHKKFPLTTELAVDWAHGDSGSGLQDEWLGLLLQAMNRPVQPDNVPAHFIYGKKIRVMFVTNANEKFSFNAAWRHGHIMSEDDVVTLSSLRGKFRREFSETEQPLASALAQFLQPNCFPDVALTQDARDFSVRTIVASDHFETGQAIVQRGEKIGPVAKAALDQLTKALAANSVVSRQIAAEKQRAQQASDLAQQESQRAQLAAAQAQTEHDAAQLAQQQQQQAQLDRDRAELQAQEEKQQASAAREQALLAQIQAQKIHERDEWFLAALAGVSLLAVAIVWQLIRQRRTISAISVPAKLQRMEKPGALPAEIAPYLAQTLKEAVVQGLAQQRAELLEAQRLAAAEISELVQRLDQLQAPMQERLRAYQDRIQELQKDLAERNEENRELLKMKIEMMRRQIETERGRVKFN